MTVPGRILGVIPAKARSKRVPYKNKKLLAGKPLTQYTAEAALRSGIFSQILISSDDAELLEYADNEPGLTALPRPAALAHDSSSSDAVVADALERQEDSFDFICKLQPTSPLRSAEDLRKALSLLKREGTDGVISVGEMSCALEWVNTLPPDLSMVSFLRPQDRTARSQDLGKHYYLNGAIYLAKVDRFLEANTFFLRSNVVAYVMPRLRSLDIDTVEDFELVELLLRGMAAGS